MVLRRNRLAAAGARLPLAMVLGLGLLAAGCGSEPESDESPEIVQTELEADGASGAEAEAAEEEAPDEAASATEDESADAGAGMEAGSDADADAGAVDEAGADAAAGADEPSATSDTLLAGYAKMAEQPAWRMTQRIVSSGAGEIEQVLEFQKPDRFRMRMDEMQLIMIGSQVYLKADDEWIANQEMGTMISGVLEQLPGASGAPAQIEGLQSVEDLGAEQVNGEMARKLGYVIEVPQSGTVEVTVWFRESDGLPLRQEMTSSYGEFEAEITADFDYDASIEIEAPTS